jgi:hypothetical protein
MSNIKNQKSMIVIVIIILDENNDNDNDDDDDDDDDIETNIQIDPTQLRADLIFLKSQTNPT